MSRKILYLSNCSPWPATGGGSQRTNLLYRALRECGQVDTLLIGPTEIAPDDESVLRRDFGYRGCTTMPTATLQWPWRWLKRVSWSRTRKIANRWSLPRFLYRPDTKAARWLDGHIRHGSYDLIVTRYTSVAAVSGALRYRPVMIDIDDLDFRQEETLLEARPGGLIDRAIRSRRIGYIKKAMPRVFAEARHLWISNPADAQRIDHPSIGLLPNIPFTESSSMREASSRSGDSRTIVMVANWSVSNNIDAANYFLFHIWPTVLKACPDATIRLVGSIKKSKWRDLWEPVRGVEMAGFVDDLRSVYRDAAFAVAPIRYGAGTKIKVLEALGLGRTCVVTPHTYEGFADTLRDNESLRRGENAEQLAAICVELLNNPAERDRLAATGQRLVRERYTFDRFREAVVGPVRRVLETSTGLRSRGAEEPAAPARVTSA